MPWGLCVIVEPPNNGSTLRPRGRRLSQAIAAHTPCDGPSPAGTKAFALLLGTLGAMPAAATSTWYVNTTGDPGPPGTLSLRQAVDSAGYQDTITFTPDIVGATITLAQGEIPITAKSVSIEGPGATKLTISGGNASRIFRIDHGNSFKDFGVPWVVSISGVTLSGGAHVNCGAAVYAYTNTLPLFSELDVFISNARITGNTANKFGGGVCIVRSNVYIDNTRISGNTAAQYGAGILASSGAVLHLSQSSVTDNQIPAPGGPVGLGGGGLAAYLANSILVENTTIAKNYAYLNGGGVRLLDAQSANNSTFNFVTIADNTTAGNSAGNGILANAGEPKIYVSVIAGNSSRGAGNDDLSGLFKMNYSLVQSPGTATFDVASSSNSLGIDPMLGPLGDHGGNGTLCEIPKAGSPVIDTGYTAPAVDQRGYPRGLLTSPDKGAVERQDPEDSVFRDEFES